MVFWYGIWYISFDVTDVPSLTAYSGDICSWLHSGALISLLYTHKCVHKTIYYRLLIINEKKSKGKLNK